MSSEITPELSLVSEIKLLCESDSGYGMHQLACIARPDDDCSCSSERDAGQELADRVSALIAAMEGNAQPCAGGRWLRYFDPEPRP